VKNVIERAKAGQEELCSLQLLKPSNDLFINFDKYSGMEKETQKIPENVQEYISEVSA
jgi:hypothetical protein